MDITEPVLVWTGNAMLDAHLALPRDAAAIVIMASAPARADGERDQRLIDALYAARIATLRVPLLTEEELRFESAHFRFDVEMLASRFLEIAQWLRRHRATSDLPLIYMASSGAAAGALIAAAQRPDLVHAVVSIDGRTDFAFEYLRRIETPALLVVKDLPVLRMNREALPMIRGEKRIEVVHEGLDALVTRTVNWLTEHVAAAVTH